MATYNILVVFHNKLRKLRQTNADAVWAFARHAPHRCFYFNTFEGEPPGWLLRVKFDLIVFHQLFMSERWAPKLFETACQKVRALKTVPAVKVCMPQDEFVRTDLICNFVNEFGIDHLLVIAPPRDWPNLFPTIDRSKVDIRQILAGYLEPRTMARIEQLRADVPLRSIDVGYRSYRHSAWLGRHTRLKWMIAEKTQEASRGLGLTIDVSTRTQDVFLGEDWYSFLLRCKSVIGVEGGAGVIDRDGSIQERTEAYEKLHPEASFEEIEAACFPGQDGRLGLQVITPRNLECSLTRTCQILMEGSYNGILRPEEHYIPIHKDFGNLAEALLRSRDPELRRRLTETAYRDLVVSGLYTYPHFVNEVIAEAASQMRRLPLSPAQWARSVVCRHALRLHQWRGWRRLHGQGAQIEEGWEARLDARCVRIARIGNAWRDARRAVVAWVSDTWAATRCAGIAEAARRWCLESSRTAGFVCRAVWHRVVFLLRHPREGMRRARPWLRNPRSSASRLIPVRKNT